jgi:hypothetical protein
VLFLVAYQLPELLARASTDELSEPFQSFEAAVSSIVFLGAAGVFLFTLETRVKRRRVLKAIHELRALAHVIDMHQLNKDPKDPRVESYDTASSPTRDLTHFELSRYLDYCSELLALCGKIAAIYSQALDDGVVLASASEIESLCTGLSRKIWQKINVLKTPPAAPTGG